MLATCHLSPMACLLYRLEGIVPLSPAEETYGFATVFAKL